MDQTDGAINPSQSILVLSDEEQVAFPSPPEGSDVYLKKGRLLFYQRGRIPEDKEGMVECQVNVSPEGTRYYFPQFTLAGDELGDVSSDEDDSSDGVGDVSDEEPEIKLDDVAVFEETPRELSQQDLARRGDSQEDTDKGNAFFPCLVGDSDPISGFGNSCSINPINQLFDSVENDYPVQRLADSIVVNSGIVENVVQDLAITDIKSAAVGFVISDEEDPVNESSNNPVNKIGIEYCDDGMAVKELEFNKIKATLGKSASGVNFENVEANVVTNEPYIVVTNEPNKIKDTNVKVKGNGDNGESYNAVIEKVEHVGNSGLVCVQVPPRSWANVVRGPENVTFTPMGHPGVEESKRPPKMMKLSLQETIVKEDGNITTKIPKVVANKGIEIWKHTLVGYFYDKPPPHRIIRECANNLWERFGFHKMTPYENGLFIFQFKDEKGMDLVMERGPWSIHRYPIFLKKWSPNEDCLKESFKTIPVWVKFFGIPLKYWTEEGLSHVASTIGVPLHADHITAGRDRIEFARICIDFNVESKFPNSVFIEEEDGPGFKVRLEYSWIPKVCDKCRLFGHRVTSCTNVVEKVWVPKEESEQARRVEGKVEGSRGIESPTRPHLISTLGSRSSKKENGSLGKEVEPKAPIERQDQLPKFSRSIGVHQTLARGTVTPPPPLVGNEGTKEEAPFIHPSDCLRPRYSSGARKTSVEVSNPFEHLLEVDDDVDDDDYDMSPRTSGLANAMDSREKHKKKLKCLRNVC